MVKILIPFFFLLMIAANLHAESIIKKRHADGSVEFSNIESNVHYQKTLIYKSKSGDIVTFSDQKPMNTAYEILQFDCFACNPHSSVNWHKVKLNLSAYQEEISQAANTFHLDPALIRALIHAESGFNPNAQSKKGAQGLMQLMPVTAKELGIQNCFDPEQNIFAGSQYLTQLLKRFNGDTKLATAAYNAGPDAVEKYHGIPPYKETKVYVERVHILHQRYKQYADKQ